ncbi:MAG: glycoside hydrolase TIM-barrel-like domain-containing protein, partial [Pseudomonadota bacterium]
ETGPTGWVPGSKPIWFTEVGIPAVDKGGNQPNVFFDPKSSESFLPYFSSGARDDFAQRRGLEALLDYWRGADETRNPAGMLDVDATHLWTWDARPFPVYPLAEDVWGDGPNWARGHWLSGRLGQAPARELIGAILMSFGIEDFDVSAVDGTIDGYVVDRPMTPRDAIEPLMLALNIEAFERKGRLVFRSQRHLPSVPVEADQCVDNGKTPVIQVTRAQEAEIAAKVALTFSDLLRDHGRSSVGAMRGEVGSRHEAHADLPIVSQGDIIQPLAESWLHDLWIGRDAFGLSLPPSRMALEPGDLIALDREAPGAVLKIEDLRRASALRIEARRYDRAASEATAPNARAPLSSAARPRAVVAEGAPHARILQLPKLGADDPDTVLYAAALQTPWPGLLGVWVETGDSVVRAAHIDAPAVMGTTRNAFPAAPIAIWDEANHLDVELFGGSFQGLPDASVFDGGNAIAIGTAEAGWEIVQFARADLVVPAIYRLSRLLRGLKGTEAEIPALRPAGADVVLLDAAVTPVDLGLDRFGRPTTCRIGHRPEPGNCHVTTVSPEGRGMRPFAPCHARATRTADGLRIDWTRRTRAGGDNWFVQRTPLGEAEERYRLEIRHESGSRMMEVGAPSFLYAQTDVVADHGGVPDSLDMRIAQIGEVIGAGAALDVRVPVTRIEV